MKRRSFAITMLVSAAWPGVAAEDAVVTVRGKLGAGATLVLSGKTVRLSGDEATTGVLNDSRLAGVDFEAAGRYKEPGVFAINPIHTRSMFVHKDGKRLAVTYWCDVCYIRTYTPGVCWCCQDDTKLDLIHPDKLVEK